MLSSSLSAPSAAAAAATSARPPYEGGGGAETRYLSPQDSAPQRVADEALNSFSALADGNFSPAAAAAVPAEKEEYPLLGRMRPPSPVSPYQQDASVKDKETEFSIGCALTYVKDTFMEVLEKVYEFVRPYFPCCNREDGRPSTETRLTELEFQVEQLNNKARSETYDVLRTRLIDTKRSIPEKIDVEECDLDGLDKDAVGRLIVYVNNRIERATGRACEYKLDIDSQTAEIHGLVRCTTQFLEILNFIQADNPQEQKERMLAGIDQVIEEENGEDWRYLEGLKLEGEQPDPIERQVLEVYLVLLQTEYPNKRDRIERVEQILARKPDSDDFVQEHFH